MTLVDANLLLYAYDAASPLHERARTWWEASLSKPAPVLLAWATILAFLRITTHHRILKSPLSIEEATGHVAEWLAQPMVSVAAPSQRHWEVLEALLVESQAPGNLVPDAHLAALAIEHGAILSTTDRDFARFSGLRWENPLAE